jgi:signal transduction histidine kinase
MNQRPSAPVRTFLSVYPEQVRRLYSHATTGHIATVVNSIIVVIILWPALPAYRLLVWLSVMLGLTGARYLVGTRYGRALDKQTRARRWGRMFIAGTAASGVAWGALAIFLFPVNSSLHQLFMAFVLGGMVAGAVATYSFQRLAFVVFALPALAPITIRYLTFASDPMHLAMGGMLVLFGALMIGSSLSLFSTHHKLLELDLENRRLIGHLVEQNRQAEVMTSELRRLTAHLDSVREEESKRIASEIHDQLGQSLSAAKFELARLGKSAGQSPGEIAKRSLAIGVLLDQMIAEVRRIVRHLRPQVLDDLGLEAAVEWLVDDFQERTQIECRLERLPTSDPVNAACATTVFRVLQEALTNVARHAHATSVWVLLDLQREDVLLSVRDNGQGISSDFASPSTFGVLSMRERAYRLGGRLEVTRAEDGGTIVSMQIPRSNCLDRGAA